MKKTIDMKDLKAQFDNVYLRHERGEYNEGGCTVAYLIKGDIAYCGVALRFQGDQFNRRRGRQIALGRALHAFDVCANGKNPRTRRKATSFWGKLADINFGENEPVVNVENKV